MHRRVAADVVGVFRRLYAARFPIRRMRPVSAYRGSDDASMAADNTSSFNCRRAVGASSSAWSMHAYGLAIDVNPVENPYVLGGRARPPAGRSYLDRAHARPGMATPGGVLVRAFERAGWSWGGRWAGTPDYQHFSCVIALRAFTCPWPYHELLPAPPWQLCGSLFENCGNGA